MIRSVIDWSGRHPLPVFLFATVLAVAGLWSARNAPLDAIPDLSDPQVVVFAEWMGRSPELVEEQVTYPLVTGLQSLPGVREARGTSMFGMAFVYALLDEGTDPYWARSRVTERLQQLAVRLPPDVGLSLGPDASAVGWVFQYVLVDRTGRMSPADLRSLQDWTVRFALEAVEGVAEVASLGGFEKQIQVVLDPERLRASGVAVRDLAAAVARSNRDVGGRVVEEGGREIYVQGRGYVRDLADLDRTAVGRSPDGAPIPLAAVASVELGPEIRRGIAVLDDVGEAVGGVVVARQGQNALAVIDGVKAALSELVLPEGVELVTVYDRSDIIRGAVATLRTALFEEMILIAAVLGIILLHARSVLIPLVVLPVAVATSFVPMYLLGITVNIVSLAGIVVAIGDMLDAVVLMVENASRRLEQHPERDRKTVILDAARELGGPLTSSLLLIAVSFLPIFALEAQEGRLFRPLATTKTFAMLSATLFTLTLAPALAVLLLRGRLPREEAHPVGRALRWLYRPVAEATTRRPWTVVGAAVVALAATVPVYRSLGSEFMPPLWEESVLYMPVTFPGISVEQARRLLEAQNRAILEIPEVVHVLGKAGRAETATDPAPLSMIESTITLAPRKAWRAGLTPDALVREMEARLRFPGVQNAFTMPIRARVDMLTTGIRTPVGVKVFGSDIAEIEEAALRIEQALRDVPGTRSVYAERQRAGVVLDVIPRREDLLRHAAVVDDLFDVVDLGLGGMPLGRFFDGRERYTVIARFGRDFRADESTLGRLPVPTALGTVPVSDVADIRRAPTPAMLVNEAGRLAAYVYVDPGDRDLGGYVAEARRVVDRLDLPSHLRVKWTGQYEFLERARARLAVMVPITVTIVIVLVYLGLGSLKSTLLVLSVLPLSALGGLWYLAVAGFDTSVAAWVAIIALLGVAAQTGTVLTVYLDRALREARAEGPVRREDLPAIAAHAATTRLRGIVLVLATNILGILPLLLATGIGADLSRRMAGPLFGGLLTMSLATLLFLPPAWVLLHRREMRGGEDADHTEPS